VTKLDRRLGDVEVEVEEGSLVPSMRETGFEGHYTANRQNKDWKTSACDCALKR